ncbi:response regulator [Bacteroidota bacterium]
MSLTFLIAGLLALIFEVLFLSDYPHEIYVSRLAATLFAFIVYFATYFRVGKNHPIILTHILLLLIITSFAVLIYFIPETLTVNSHIISLILFTVGLFLIWEVANQIIVAIYFNIIFACSIIFNDSSVYLLPNILESLIFVFLMGIMSIAASEFRSRQRSDTLVDSYKDSPSEQKFKNIFENSIEGRFQMSMDGKLTVVNTAFINMLGYSKAEQVIRLDVVKDLYKTPKDSETFNKLLDRTGKIKNFRVSLKKQDGSEIIVRINANVNYNENDEPVFLEGSMQDITTQVIAEKEKKKALEDLQAEKSKQEKARQKAQSESESKTKFLANLSHEIKTPLNSVVGFLTMIENDLFETKEEMIKFASEVKTASDSILDIIGKNLDLTRIETGKLELDEGKFNFRDEVNKAISVISSEVKRKKLKLTTNLDDNISTVLVGDALRYRQILVNLLSNAVKFTDSGEISLLINQSGKTKTHTKILTTIQDTGIGIPLEKQAFLFDPFFRAHKEDDNKKGTGLGLVIAGELTKLMGGEINFESKPGEGSKFYFTAEFKLFHTEDGTATEPTFKTAVKPEVIPEVKPEVKAPGKTSEQKVERAAAAAAALKRSDMGKPMKKILLVEDNPISQNVEMKLLTEVGYDVEAVANAAEAIALLQEFQFDLVLMDIEMTDMDGITATKTIRELAGDVKNIPIIAVTAHSSMKDRERCLEAGMNDYIAKPINIHFLKMTIDQWLKS